ncbi:MAG: peptidase A2A retrovirus catalytic [Spirulina sp.]
MTHYSYTKISNNSPIPIIKLKLINPNNTQLSNLGDGILDTGADCTLVPISLIAELNLKKLGRSDEFISSVGEREIITVPYRIAIAFPHKHPIKTKIYACPDPATKGFIIIGRNILNRYCITFNGRKRFFTIE